MPHVPCPPWRIQPWRQSAALTRWRPAASPWWRARCPRSGRQSPAYRPQVLFQSAFTLIEILVAMAVLALMVLMVSNIFQGSTEAVALGTQKADMNTAARAALDFVARELEAAVAGPVESLSSSAKPITFRLSGGTNLQFASLAGDVALGRALRGAAFEYDKDKNTLKYERWTESFKPYKDDWSGGSGRQLLITNVWSMTVCVYSNEQELFNGIFKINYTSSNSLPICVDIAIEMLAQDDIVRARTLAGTDQDDYVARHSKLYSTRVYPANRRGYGGAVGE